MVHHFVEDHFVLDHFVEDHFVEDHLAVGHFVLGDFVLALLQDCCLVPIKIVRLHIQELSGFTERG